MDTVHGGSPRKRERVVSPSVLQQISYDAALADWQNQLAAYGYSSNHPLVNPCSPAHADFQPKTLRHSRSARSAIEGGALSSPLKGSRHKQGLSASASAQRLRQAKSRSSFTAGHALQHSASSSSLRSSASRTSSPQKATFNFGRGVGGNETEASDLLAMYLNAANGAGASADHLQQQLAGYQIQRTNDGLDRRPAHKKSRSSIAGPLEGYSPTVPAPPLPHGAYAAEEHRMQLLQQAQQQQAQHAHLRTQSLDVLMSNNLGPFGRHQGIGSSDDGASWQAQMHAMSAGSRDDTATAAAAAATRMIVNLSQQAASSASRTSAAAAGSAAAMAAGATLADALAEGTAEDADHEGFPARSVFNLTHSSHLSTIAVRRDKTLTTFVMYDSALWYLLTQAGLHEMAGRVSDTSQGERNRDAFRRWCAKSFKLVRKQELSDWKTLAALRPEIVEMLFNNMTQGAFAIASTDTGKAIMPPTSMYDLLVLCHKLTDHGGRDKTHSSLKHHCANVSKELVQAFIKICPSCSARRKAPSKKDNAAEDAESQVGDDDCDEADEPFGQTIPVPMQQPSGLLSSAPMFSGPSDYAGHFAQFAGHHMHGLSGLVRDDPTLLMAPAPSIMVRGASIFSTASDGTSSATNSTDGPRTPELDPADDGTFAWMDMRGTLHSTARLTPTTSTSSAGHAAVMAKALNFPLDSDPDTLRRFLQAAEATCTVTPLESNGNEQIDPRLLFEDAHFSGWGNGDDAQLTPHGGKKAKGFRPPPLDLSNLHPALMQLPQAASIATASSSSGSSSAGTDVPNSAYSALSEPVIQSRLQIHLPGLNATMRLDSPTSAPALQTEFDFGQENRVHVAQYMEKRSINNSPQGGSSSSHKPTPLHAIPHSQLANFGPSYGTVFGNVGVGGSGNLFEDQPQTQTAYGAPDVRVYLDATYGIPNSPGRANEAGQSSALAHQRIMTGDLGVDTVRPDMLRRHSVSGQHNSISSSSSSSSAISSNVAAKGSSDGDAASSGSGSEGEGEQKDPSPTGSVIVHNVSEPESDTDDSSTEFYIPITSTPRRSPVPGGYRAPPQTQPSPLDFTAKRKTGREAMRYGGQHSPTSSIGELVLPVSALDASPCKAAPSLLSDPSKDMPSSPFRNLSLGMSALKLRRQQHHETKLSSTADQEAHGIEDGDFFFDTFDGNFEQTHDTLFDQFLLDSSSCHMDDGHQQQH